MTSPPRREGEPGWSHGCERLRVAVLKNLPFNTWRGPGLPYRMDYLREHGIDPITTEMPWHPRAHRLALHLPPHLTQTFALAPAIARADAVLALFESSAHPLALARTFGGPMAKPPMVVLSCWLPEVLARASPRRLGWYRKAYRGVDRLLCFSTNQVGPLAEMLDLPESRVAMVPFGVDTDTFVPPGQDVASGATSRVGDDSAQRRPLLVAAGRDRGRDWSTLFRALASLPPTGRPRCRVLCRPADLVGIDVPDWVEVVGHVDRDRYRAELQAASIVAVTTHVLGYPTGQSVLLEAMACARPCVVTNTPAIGDYVRAGVDAVCVPPHDPEALAGALATTLADPETAERIGSAARLSVVARGSARTLWARVAAELVDAIDAIDAIDATEERR